MKVTDQFEITAVVIETGECIGVDNISPINPQSGSMWHNTEDGRVFHDDELIIFNE